MDKHIENNELEANSDSLERLKREVSESADEGLIDKDEIDDLHTEVLRTTAEEKLTAEKQKESAELQQEIRSSASSILGSEGKTIFNFEDDETGIAAAAQEGRDKSAGNVAAMIEKTSRIPDRLKKRV